MTTHENTTMTTTDWHKHIEEDDASTPDMDTHGHRHDEDAITAWRDEAVQHLRDMSDGTEDIELDTEDWLYGTYQPPQRWSVVCRDDEITVEWVTGKHSWSTVDAEHIISEDAIQHLLDNAN